MRRAHTPSRETVSVRRTPETAARVLWTHRRAAWWGVAVGANENDPSEPVLIVYLRRAPRANELPSTFNGYRVRAVVTGRVRPAGLP